VDKSAKLPGARATGSASGFSLIELTIVSAIMLVVGVIAIPMLKNGLQSFEAASDARAIASQIAMAHMRSAAEFTQARVNISTSAGTYKVEICTPVSGSTCQGTGANAPTWTVDGGSGGVHYLSTYSSFGYGGLTTSAVSGATIGQTTLFTFNSRGIPINPANGAAVGTDAIYLNNGNGVYYAVTVTASGRVAVWQYTGSSWTQIY